MGLAESHESDNLLREVAELVYELVFGRLKPAAQKKSASKRGASVEQLTQFLAPLVPDSVRNGDSLELIHYCRDLLISFSDKELANILELGHSEPTVGSNSRPFQPPLQLQEIEIPGTPPYYKTQAAIARKDFHRAGATPFPTASLNDTDFRGEAQLKPRRLDEAPVTKPEDEEIFAKAMWAQVNELSDLDCDVLDYCTSKWLTVANTPEECVSISIAELLSMRRIRKKTNGDGMRGGYKKSQKQALRRSLVHLENLLINLFEFRLPTGRRASSRNTECLQDRAVKIRESVQCQFFENDLPLDRFSYRPGYVFSRFLFGPGKQRALLASKALGYSLRSEKYEKRLVRYLSWHWRIRAPHLSYLQPYQVGAMLQEIKLRVDRRFPSRTRSRIEHALDKLEADGVIRAWQYENYWFDETKTRWVDDWLESTIVVEPPQGVLDKYRDIGLPEKSNDNDDFSEQLKERRSRAHQSVLAAAEESGVSRQDYLHAEGGRRPPLAVRKKLETWLRRPTAS